MRSFIQVLPLLIIFVVLLLLSFVYGPDRTIQQLSDRNRNQNSQSVESSENQPAITSSPAAPIFTNQEHKSSAQNADECSSLNADPNADLVQQCRMAVAAEEMAGWSLAQLIVGIFGTIGLIATLFAAQDANKIARKVGEAQVRAYLSAKVKIAIDWEFGSIVFGIECENTGSSPAKSVEVTALLGANATAFSDFTGLNEFYGFIGAGSKMPNRFTFKSLKNFIAIAANPVIYFGIFYVDVFGNESEEFFRSGRIDGTEIFQAKEITAFNVEIGRDKKSMLSQLAFQRTERLNSKRSVN